MTETATYLNLLLGTGGVLILAAAVFLYVDILCFGRQYLNGWVNKWGLTLAVGLMLCASVIALVYSRILGFEPCVLCWLMRVFVFSQAVILLVAWVKDDKGIAIYGLALSIPGIIVGTYHHYLQMGGSGIVCQTLGGGVDCAKRILFEYNFMTFPLLGVSLLLLVSAIYIYFLYTGND